MIITVDTLKLTMDTLKRRNRKFICKLDALKIFRDKNKLNWLSRHNNRILKVDLITENADIIEDDEYPQCKIDIDYNHDILLTNSTIYYSVRDQINIVTKSNIKSFVFNQLSPLNHIAILKDSNTNKIYMVKSSPIVDGDKRIVDGYTCEVSEITSTKLEYF